MFYYKSYKMSANTSPSPTRKLNVIQSVEDLNNVYFKCSKRLNKGKPVAGGTTYYEITCTTADGTPIMNTNIEIANVPVRGVTMPFYRKTKANYDGGAKVPQIKLVCPKDTIEQRFTKACIDKVTNAVIAFIYGLDTKPIKSIQHAPLPGSEGVFFPIVHYADGTKLTVMKSNLAEGYDKVPLQFFEVLRISKPGENDVLFAAKQPVLFKNENETGSMYPEIDLRCPGAFSMRRKQDAEATPDQLNIEKWGVQIYEMKFIEDHWVRRAENVASRVPIAKSINDKASFVGYVSFFVSYITIISNDKSKMHFEGTVSYIGPAEAESAAIPTGEFISSLPAATAIQPKKLRSKAVTGAVTAAAKATNDDEEASADEGGYDE